MPLQRRIYLFTDGGGGGLKLDKGIFYCKGVGGGRPGDFFYFQRLSPAIAEAYWALFVPQYYHQFDTRKPLNKMIFFSDGGGGVKHPILPLDPPLRLLF